MEHKTFDGAEFAVVDIPLVALHKDCIQQEQLGTAVPVPPLLLVDCIQLLVAPAYKGCSLEQQHIELLEVDNDHNLAGEEAFQQRKVGLLLRPAEKLVAQVARHPLEQDEGHRPAGMESLHGLLDQRLLLYHLHYGLLDQRWDCTEAVD